MHERGQERLEERDDSDYLAVDSSIQSPRKPSVHILASFPGRAIASLLCQSPEGSFHRRWQNLGQKAFSKRNYLNFQESGPGVSNRREGF